MFTISPLFESDLPKVDTFKFLFNDFFLLKYTELTFFCYIDANGTIFLPIIDEVNGSFPKMVFSFDEVKAAEDILFSAIALGKLSVKEVSLC